MPFDDPVVAGTSLIRAAIRSPDYVPGVSGWSINRDGTAEFNDVVVRGEFLVQDPDGSYVRIYDQNPGVGSVIDMRPADITGATILPAQILTYSIPGGASDEVSLALQGPTLDGYAAGTLFFSVRNNPSESFTQLDGDTLALLTEHLTVYNSNNTPGFEVFPDGIAPQNSILAVDGEHLGFQLETGNQLIAASAVGTRNVNTFADIPSAPTGSILKKSGNTRIEIDLRVTAYADTVAGTPEFALQIGGTDYPLCGHPMSSTFQRETFTGITTITGLAAGTYSITPRWRKSAGGGLIGRVAASETCSWRVAEVIA